MIILYIIIGYIINIFLTRWLNKVANKITLSTEIIVEAWFVPIIPIIIILGIIIIEKIPDFSPKSNWFTGKYWK